MKLDVYDPTVFVSRSIYVWLKFTFNFKQFAVHSPYEIPTNLMSFTDMGKTDEIEATYNMLETM